MNNGNATNPLPRASLADQPVAEVPRTPEDRAKGRQVLMSSFIGSVVEWYDFLLYGTAAALVFGQVFFVQLDPAVGLLASFSTLAVGYLSRPLGGIVFGHFGDRIGRKKMLMITIVLMGAASTLIGLLPTYEQIGVAAPILLVLLRLIQGFAVGGEWGGAVLMTLEHSAAKKRGAWSSVAQMGAPAGTLLSSGILALMTLLPKEQFLAWGWRVPFLLSVVLLVVAVWIRRKVSESPVFEEARKQAAITPGSRIPILEVLKHNKARVALAVLIGLGPFVHNGVVLAFVIAYSQKIGISSTTALVGNLLSAVVTIFTLPLFAALSDRVGRRPVTLWAGVLLAVNAFVLFGLVNTGNAALYLVTIVTSGVIHSAMYGPMAAFMAEMFGTGTRYTGTSLGYQLASVVGGGFGPLIAASLLALGGGAPNTIYISMFIAASCMATVVAAYFVSETNRRDLTQSVSFKQ
jgi:MHS family shikimate/dehydroshikimate transporter-like MFS transporter